jgi:hypothetical protein
MDTARKNSLRVMARLYAVLTGLILAVSAFAQDVTVVVNPVQHVLPPQSGRYLTDPGRYFTIQLFNQTDEPQLVHLGLQIQQRFPNDELWVSTNMETGHIPRQPIIIEPNQHKTLNPVEMKHLFDHFTSSDIFIRDGRHLKVTNGDYGLLPEGEYEAFITAYKWNPDLTSPVVVSSPSEGRTMFSICYEAEPPKFIYPVITGFDGDLNDFRVAKLDVNDPSFEWMAPTLNCNASMVNFKHNIRIVEYNEALMPDEVMQSGVPTFLEKAQIVGNRYTIPPAYARQMIEPGKAKGKVYAVQLTATTDYFRTNAGSVNFTLLKNDGKSPILLFQLYDPRVQEDLYELSLEDTDSNLDKKDSLYVFEQPLLTRPWFEGVSRVMTMGRDIPCEWRKAWFAGGMGERQDTVDFKYNLCLYKGNSADTKDDIYKSAPIWESQTEELNDTIKWAKIKDKVEEGDYFILRVTAEATNEKSIRMLPDSLNFIDFATTVNYSEMFAYQCGNDDVRVKNTTSISKKPSKDQRIKIGQFYMTLNDDVQFNSDNALEGTGWVNWAPSGDPLFNMKALVAVKFDNLKINTDYEVFEGVCKTYGESTKEGGYDESMLDSLFSDNGINNVFGALALPDDVRDKVSDYGTDASQSLAKSYNLGKFYSQYKTARKVWDSWNSGEVKLYFPVEMPQQIKQFLPTDFNIQIANMQFTPQSAQMNLIGEVALPNSDVFEGQNMLIFGAPRLCISPDRFFPEEGVLALLSNLPLKDPSSDFKMVFKAPHNPNAPEPNDGCFLQWDKGEFSGLGLEIAVTIPNTKRVIDGKVSEGVPALLDLSTVIRANERVGDFIAEGTLTPFEVNDLPGWKFAKQKGGNEMKVIFDHNMSENGKGMPTLEKIKEKFPSNTFDPSLCGTSTQSNWNAWQGVYISELSVEFPKFAIFGSGDQGLTIGARDMIIDASGVTCQVFADDIFSASTGSCGGWAFSVKNATVDIIQNNFDNCALKGGFGVPLLGKAAQAKAAKESGEKTTDKEDGTDIEYTCQIRHLTKPKAVTYQALGEDGEQKVTKSRKVYDDDRLAYLFRTENVDKNALTMNFFVAEMTLTSEQTYFLVEARDKDDGKTETQVELCMGGKIVIAGTEGINDRLKKISEKLGDMKLKLPDITFCKMRLSNTKEADWKEWDLDDKKLHQTRLESEANTASDNSKNLLHYTFAQGGELELGKECYFNYGEWALASEAKKLGPFSFDLEGFDVNYSNEKLLLDVKGKIGLIEDQVSVSAGVGIEAKLHKNGGISNWYFSDGRISFKELAVDVEFTGLALKGMLKMQDEPGKDKGYAGSLDVSVVGLFKVSCTGGYYSHKASAEEKLKLKDKNEDSYSWGYFTCDLEMDAKTSILRVDPVVITRISGGFYVNCKPNISSGGMDARRGDPPTNSTYGAIGVSFGMGLAASSGEETLSGSVDLTVVYNRKLHKLTSFVFLGNVNALSGIVNSDVKLVYINENGEGDNEDRVKDRYLCLNITTSGGYDNKTLNNYISKATGQLTEMKSELDAFNNKLNGFADDPYGGLGALKSTYANKTGEKAEKKVDSDSEMSEADKARFENKAGGEENKEGKTKAGEFVIPLELKITWVENYVKDKRWHLYLGEPDKDKRCKFTLIDFKDKSGIVSVNIGADSYLCIGNELPNHGQLPPIPQEITEFLNGHKKSTASMGADMAKLDRSRAKVVSEILNNADGGGGVMLGASAWGFIDVNLGLFYADLRAIAGFDVAMVHYDTPQYCDNYGGYMGHNGWYAMGQLYAYLAAKFGLHIKLGKLIDERIDLVDAGIGGLLEVGLPRPTWVEGKARVKVHLLGGLVKIDKSFSFAAGDHCVPFKGNALDDFALFGDCSIASDSLAEGWDEKNAISIGKARNAVLETYAGLGENYRLYDPTTGGELESDTGYDETQLKPYASRTYVFDIDKTRVYAENAKANVNKCLGVKLYEIPGDIWDRSKYAYAWDNIISRFSGNRWNNAILGRWMKSSSLDSETKPYPQYWTDQDAILDKSRAWEGYGQAGMDHGARQAISKYEVTAGVGIVESKGRRFHLKLPQLKPDCYYILEVSGQAFEILNGKRVWTQMTVEDIYHKKHKEYVRWEQKKLFFFRTKSEDEQIPEQIFDIQPYVALAYPSVGINKLFNKKTDAKFDKANFIDLKRPVIALNTDIRDAFKDGKLEWEMNCWGKHEVISNEWEMVDGGLVMQPKIAFDITSGFDEYRLRLNYKYQVPYQCKGANIQGQFVDKSQIYMTKFLELPENDKAEASIKMLKALGVDDDVMKKQGFTDVKTMTIEQKNNVIYSATLLILMGSFTNNTEKVNQMVDVLGEYCKDIDIKETTCYKDTTVVLADMWLGQEDHDWCRGIGYQKPYEKQFIGVRPTSLPTFSDQYIHAGSWDKDLDIVFNKGGLRLTDPYLYFAYLSKWVFIGDMQIEKYSFDNVKIPYASESLTFSYNGHDITGSLMKGNSYQRGKNYYLNFMRRDMYNAWAGAWWVDNASIRDNQSAGLIKYPLPTIMDDDWGLTVANSNGITPTWVKYNQNNEDADFGIRNLVYDFLAPYYIADALSKKMKEICEEFIYWYNIDIDEKDKYLNNVITNWQNTHRGQYLTIESRGYTVKVPYYQFPLIFGGCFGGGKEFLTGDDVSRSNRSFDHSLKKAELPDERRDSKTSNLVFFRLCGGVPFQTYDNKYTDNYRTMNDEDIKDVFNKAKQQELDSISAVLKKIYYVKEEYDEAFETYKKDIDKKYDKYWEKINKKNEKNKKSKNNKNAYKYVDYDEFYLSGALKSIKEFTFQGYRVNNFNLGTGQYTYYSGLGPDEYTDNWYYRTTTVGDKGEKNVMSLLYKYMKANLKKGIKTSSLDTIIPVTVNGVQQ